MCLFKKKKMDFEKPVHLLFILYLYYVYIYIYISGVTFHRYGSIFTFTFMHLADGFFAFRLHIFISTCDPWESNPQPFALQTQCSTTEPHRNTIDISMYV